MNEHIGAILRKKRVEAGRRKRRKNMFMRMFSFPRRKGIVLIAEIKLSSPTEGILGQERDIEKRVKQYVQGGADAISVVTEKDFFQGDLSFVPRIRKITQVPILVKDFIVDEYQIYSAASAGADAVLLIAKIVRAEKLSRLIEFCRSVQVEPVVEVQNKRELAMALRTDAHCIAVNARNLRTLQMSVKKACILGNHIPTNRIFLGFSGVKRNEDVKLYALAGARGILVGTALMKSDDIGGTIHELLGETAAGKDA